MTITLHCSKCKSGSKVGTTECRKCKTKFKSGKRKYRVSVRLANGKRKSRLVESLSLAKKLETKFKTQSIEAQAFDIHKAPLLYDIWDQYLKWAKIHKKSWKDDEDRWRVHIKPVLFNIPMDKISPLDIEVVLNRMLGADSKIGRPYTLPRKEYRLETKKIDLGKGR